MQDEFVNEFQQTRSIRNGLQYAWHGIAGVEYDLGKNIEVNVEAYYKYFSQLSNINQNKLYEDIAEFDQLMMYSKKTLSLNQDNHMNYFLLKYSKNRLFLWGVYCTDTIHGMAS